MKKLFKTIKSELTEHFYIWTGAATAVCQMFGVASIVGIAGMNLSLPLVVGLTLLCIAQHVLINEACEGSYA